jgi:ArsR family transcriptional regulator
MSNDPIDNHEHDTLRTDATESDETYQKAAQLFKALADPERLKLLTILANGEACVSELASKDQMSTVSQRLKLLRNENLVSNKRDGKHMIYQLSDHHVFKLIENAIAHVKETR